MTEISRRELLKAGAALAVSPAAIEMFGINASAGPKRFLHEEYREAKLLEGEPPKPDDGSFTLVVMPDTQHYSEAFPQTFMAQTEWIRDNRAARNIAAVIHLGDITNCNTPQEWINATQALQVLDDHVPYVVTTGNHDYSEGGVCKDRMTRLNNFFCLREFQQRPTFGGVYDMEPNRLENNYHLLDVAGRKLLILALEFGPRRDVVRWANDVVAQHHDRSVILATHAYIYNNDTRYDWKQFGRHQSWNPHSYAMAAATRHDVCDGEELWTELVSRHENFILTLNGHVLGPGLGHVETSTPAGRNVQQFLVNFQMKPQGGDGWLRLLEFRPDGRTVQVYDYSPTRNECNVAARNRFAFSVAADATL